MPDLKRITVLSIVMLVVLRISIGWQFLYEGLWKIDSLDSPRPWSAEGYLKNARGPFRDMFRNMTGDPDDKRWLTYDAVASDWDAWQKRFVSHYPDLTDRQIARLDQLINGVRGYNAALDELPENVTLKDFPKSVTWDGDRKQLVVDGKLHITPRERQQLRKLVPDVREEDGELVGGTEVERKFYRAVDQAYARSARLSYKEKLAASLKGNPERAGVINPRYEGTIDYKRVGDIEKYYLDLQRYEEQLASARQDFEHDHLDHLWRELQQKKAELVGPVKALDSELRESARKLLTTEQLAAGPVPPARDQMWWVNLMTIVGLTALGLLLIVGLATRVAAIGGAVMLFSFYLVMPPWPGVPEAPGPEHSFLVNKNLIEVFALVAIATLPTGTWFGIDGIFSRLLASWRMKKQTGATAPANTAAETSPRAEETREPAAAGK